MLRPDADGATAVFSAAHLFPVVVSAYNLVMHLRHRKDSGTGDVAA